MKIGIDLGGTNIKLGLVDEDRIIDYKIMPCPALESEEIVISSICNLISEFLHYKIESIGIGVPSVVDTHAGIVYDVVNIPSWKEVYIKKILEDRFAIPTYVNNDANCFILGEKEFGLGKNDNDIVGLTLGTGLGSGIIIDGNLYNGVNTGAGEIGNINYLDKDYEYYCSSRFFLEKYNTTGEEVALLASQHDAQALLIWKDFGVHIGNLIKLVILAYDPSLIILGGSISKAYKYFEVSMRKEMEIFQYPKSIAKIRIECSTDKYISILGASSLGD